MKKAKLESDVSKKEEEILIKKSLNYSTKDGVFSTVCGATGDNFISPYAVSLGASNLQIGLLSAIPNLIPSELFTSKAMEKYSRKSIALLGVLLQVLIWPFIALLGVIAYTNKSFAVLAPTLLILLYSLYVGVGLFMGPAWTSWMKDLTEKVKLGKYFGLRNKIFGIVSLVSIICAGLVLDVFRKMNYVFLGFMLLFLTASIARSISRRYMSKQYEPALKLDKKYYFSFWQFVKKAPTNNYGRFAIFIALLNFALMIAGPFFTPYMLTELKFNYITYTFINLIVTGTITFITMPLWGKFLDKYGCVKTMKTTALTCCLIPVLWTISPSIYWLIAVQMLSGLTWAGFNLASGTFTYHAVTKERIGICVAYASILNGIGIFLGSLAGGLLASLPIKFINVFFFVFIISTLTRLVVMYSLLPKIQEVKPVEAPHSLFKIILKPVKGMSHYLFSDVIGHLYPFSKFKTVQHKNGMQ